MRQYKLLIITGIIAAFAGYFISGLFVADDAQQRVPTARAAEVARADFRRPDFSMPDVDGTTHSISEWDGKVLIVNFWATWCTPCRKEIPEFITLQDELGEKGLQFIGIAIDRPDETRHFMQEIGINYPILVDEEQGMRLVGEYGNRLMALPYTVIIDRSGNVVHTHMGEISRAAIEELLDELI